jgi:hypothetical protein
VEQPPAYEPPPTWAGQPPMAAPPFPPPPATAWKPPPPTRGGGRVALIVAGVVGLVFLVVCVIVPIGLFLASPTKNTGSGSTSRIPLSPSRGGGPGATAEPESEQTGPEASAYPAEQIDDLDRVCEDNVFYPASPKRAGKPKHPVVLLVDDGSGTRIQNSSYFYSQGYTSTVKQTWAATDPRKVQMVACLDRVGTGSTLRRCKYDEPKPETVSLMRANWRLKVYEVATGRRLLNKAMPGDDKACPYFAMVYANRKIYAKVSDRALVVALRNLVNK